MLVATRIGTALFSLIALGTGSRALLTGLDLALVSAQVDNDYRFYAAIWFTVGIGLAWSAVELHQAATLFRFLMVALVVGGLARAIGWLSYPPDTRMIVAVVLELVVPAALLSMHALATRQRSAAPAAARA